MIFIELLFIIAVYIFIGFMLETSNSERPNLWGVFLWPALVAGCIIAYLDYKKDIKEIQKENKEYYDEN